MQKAILTLSILLGLSSCTVSPQKQFDRICAIKNKYVIMEGTPEAKAVKSAEEFKKENFSKEIKDMFSGIAAATPESRYRLMQQTAQEMGATFDCPSFQN